MATVQQQPHTTKIQKQENDFNRQSFETAQCHAVLSYMAQQLEEKQKTITFKDLEEILAEALHNTRELITLKAI